jgi:hypothetical protein
VHHHRVHADQLEQNDIAREAVLEAVFGHGVAAVFDDDGFAVVIADVRRASARICALICGETAVKSSFMPKFRLVSWVMASPVSRILGAILQPVGAQVRIIGPSGGIFLEAAVRWKVMIALEIT